MQTNVIKEGTRVLSSMMIEAKRLYNWYDVSDDGGVSVCFRSSVIRYGCYSTYVNEASFKAYFNLADIIGPDGVKRWPLTEQIECLENPETISKLGHKLMLDSDARCAIYRGRYLGYSRNHTTNGKPAQIEFVFDSEHPKHLLFVSDKNLGCAGNIFNCDVIICRGFNAMPLSTRTVRYLMGRERII